MRLRPDDPDRSHVQCTSTSAWSVPLDENCMAAEKEAESSEVSFSLYPVSHPLNDGVTHSLASLANHHPPPPPTPTPNHLPLDSEMHFEDVFSVRCV